MQTLSLACWNYDRCEPLIDGRVAIDGIRLLPKVIYPSRIFAEAFTRASFDICELSASSYLMQVAQGKCEYTAIPVFVSRAFRHNGFYVRADSGIASPKDLEGRVIGVPEYQMTMALWARGILQDDYGVDCGTFKTRTGGTNKAGRKERLPLALPSNMDVRPIGKSETLNDLMLAGALDAMISPTPPQAFIAGDSRVRRLFAEPAAEERIYFKRHGLFPIMHVIGIRRQLVDANTELAVNVFKAFVLARRMAMDRLKETATASANRLHLPWLAAEWEATRALMGNDYWPYGVEENIADLEALCRYSYEQHLSSRRVNVGELFVPATMDLPGR